MKENKEWIENLLKVVNDDEQREMLLKMFPEKEKGLRWYYSLNYLIRNNDVYTSKDMARKIVGVLNEGY